MAQPPSAGLYRGVFTARNLFGSSQEFVLTVAVEYVPSDPNPGFNTGAGPDRTVYALASDAAGRIYIGGEFTSYNGAAAPALARLQPNGALDAGFAASGRPSGTVRALALQADGNILVGGDFTGVGSAAAGRLARLLPTGALDPAFNVGSGANAPVRAVLVQADGRIVVAGDFTSFNGQPANYLVRLNANGSIDGTFRTGPAPSGPNSQVYALAAAGDGKIYIGGWFGAVDGQPASRIARLLANGHLDPSFSSQGGVGQGTEASNQDPYRPGTITSGSVNALLVTAGGRLIVGGDFNTAAGRPAYRLAAFEPNGSVIRDFGNLLPANGAVTALLAQSADQIVVAGTFSLLGGEIRAGLARINANGVIDPSFVAPVLEGQATLNLQALAGQSDGSLLIAGNFPGLSGATQVRVGKLYGTPGLEPFVTSPSLLGAVLGADFDQLVTVAGAPDAVPATFRLTAGALPAGLSLNSSTGRITGRPSVAGTYNFTVTATRGTLSQSSPLTLVVSASSGVTQPEPPLPPVAALLPDFTGDGKSDILWRHGVDGRVHVWEMSGTTRVRGVDLPAVADLAWRVVGAGDFSGDGKVDILWRHGVDGRVVLWAMNGAAVSGVVNLPSVVDWQWQIGAVGDMTGDGKVDIVWQHRGDGRVHVWEMNGVTPVRGVDLPAVGDLGWKIGMVAEMTGDGRNDLVWRHEGDGRVVVWEMNGTVLVRSVNLPGVTDTGWEIGGTSADRYEVKGDLSGDRWADVLWQYRGNGQVHVWEMNAATPVRGINLPVVGDLNWRIGGMGDFSGDGWSDILWRHGADGRVLVWTMRGTTPTGAVALTTVTDLNWQVVGTGDFTGDGKVDILWRHGGNGQVLVWTMNGTTMTGMVALPTVGDLNWQVGAVGDLTGDGKVDVLWRHGGNGAVHVWEMNGTVPVRGVDLPRVNDLGWQIVALGDGNGDGWLDIGWRNSTTGAVVGWSMLGTTPTGVTDLPTVPNANWQIFNK
jgi:uncharacterized delta-60 repeat protein